MYVQVETLVTFYYVISQIPMPLGAKWALTLLRAT